MQAIVYKQDQMVILSCQKKLCNQTRIVLIYENVFVVDYTVRNVNYDNVSYIKKIFKFIFFTFSKILFNLFLHFLSFNTSQITI